MLNALLVGGAVVCAVLAIRARQLLSAALWLAGVSALAAIILYQLGAQQVAVMELSVGAGLVTVLFVFAISIAGDDGLGEREFIPNWLAIGMVAAFLLILGAMVLPVDEVNTAHAETSLQAVLWDERGLDMILQVVLIFTGVLCLIALLSGGKIPTPRFIAPSAPDREPVSSESRRTPSPLPIDHSPAGPAAVKEPRA